MITAICGIAAAGEHKCYGYAYAFSLKESIKIIYYTDIVEYTQPWENLLGYEIDDTYPATEVFVFEAEHLPTKTAKGWAQCATDNASSEKQTKQSVQEMLQKNKATWK